MSETHISVKLALSVVRIHDVPRRRRHALL